MLGSSLTIVFGFLLARSAIGCLLKLLNVTLTIHMSGVVLGKAC